MNQQQKIEATKQAIIALLQANGPQTIEQIVAECKTQAFIGCMAFALSNLNFNAVIYWDESAQAYDVA